MLKAEERKFDACGRFGCKDFLFASVFNFVFFFVWTGQLASQEAELPSERLNPADYTPALPQEVKPPKVFRARKDGAAQEIRRVDGVKLENKEPASEDAATQKADKAKKNSQEKAEENSENSEKTKTENEADIEKSQADSDESNKSEKAAPNLSKKKMELLPGASASPENDLLEYALMLYANNQLVLARDKLGEFVERFPKSKQIAKAKFFHAESMRKLGDDVRAQKIYLTLARSGKGHFAGNSAYRLGAIEKVRKNFLGAVEYYEQAASLSDSAKVRLVALWQRARILEFLKKYSQAKLAYEDVAKIEGFNPVKDVAISKSAKLSLQEGDLDEAAKNFKILSEEARDKELRAEAMTHMADILMIKKKEDEAQEYYQKVIALGKIPEKFRSHAQFGIMKKKYLEKDYQAVINLFRTGLKKLKEEDRPQMLLMVGNAYRFNDQCLEAIKLYRIAEEYYAKNDFGREAAFRKLLCYHKAKDPNLPVFVDAFITYQKMVDPGHKFVYMAYFLKGDLFFQDRDYKKAAKAFANAVSAKLSKRHQNELLYKLALAQRLSGDCPNALNSLEKFINKYPEDDKLPQAIASAALCFMKEGNYKSALNYYKKIIKEYADSNVGEIAFLNSAVIIGEKNENPKEMIKILKKFIKERPKSEYKAAALLHIAKGYMQQKEYKKALPFFAKARLGDRKKYYRDATRNRIFAYYFLKNKAKMASELDLYLENYDIDSIPKEAVAWLGIKYFNEEDFENASKYLGKIVNTKKPHSAPKVVWEKLALAKYKLGEYRDALADFKILAQLSGDRGTGAANAKLLLAKAYFANGYVKQAEKYAQACDSLVSEHVINAKAALLLGDIACQRENYDEALGFYTLVHGVWDDPKIAPLTLKKMIRAFERAGYDDDRKKYAALLVKDYPNFKAPLDDTLLDKPLPKPGSVVVTAKEENDREEDEEELPKNVPIDEGDVNEEGLIVIDNEENIRAEAEKIAEGETAFSE